MERIEKNLNGPGYTEMGTGVFVSECDVFDYAIEQCVTVVPHGLREIEWTKEFKDMLVEWFYSGNWIRSEEYGSN